MKRLLRPHILLAAALAVATAFWSAGAAELVDGIAAQVGTEVVLISEVDRIAAPIEKRMRASGVDDREIAQMKAGVLDSLIENRLLDITAERVEVEALDDEIDSAIESIAQDNGISMDTMIRSVEQQGLSYPEYRAKIGQEIVRQKVMGGMIRSKIDIKDDEVRALYAERYSDQPEGGIEVRIHHLLVPAIEAKPWAVDIACQEAREDLDRVAGGDDFLAVARETSPTDPDLGWNLEEDLAGWMLTVIQGMRPGQTSDVVPLSFGCSVLRLVDRRQMRPKTYEDVRAELQNELYNKAYDRESQALFDRLRERTYIEKKDVFAGADQLEFEAPR